MPEEQAHACVSQLMDRGADDGGQEDRAVAERVTDQEYEQVL